MKMAAFCVVAIVASLVSSYFFSRHPQWQPPCRYGQVGGTSSLSRTDTTAYAICKVRP